ncbi:hypothetical protein RD792_016076 [Penstemon davidsonii]|uniref:Uncharacterized protein n=1 Tax=Penstemon davidsonii TaxID=160366 RepID=A0ABR0CIJ2_9LAMI|nr:hypothetical protein RD792_016076 [Penstemon davidsonii]
MATLSSCKINKVHSIKKINQDHLLNRGNSERNYSISTPHSGPEPFTSYRWTQRCSEKANTILLSSKQDQHRRNGSSLKYAVTEQINVPFEEEIGKEEREISRKSLIWRAIKLPMYTVALIPVTVGSAAAYWQTGLFSTGRYFMILASFVLVIAWLNLRSEIYISSLVN